jgi:chromosome segregation ATPase
MELLKQKNTVVETSLQDEQQVVEHYKTDIKEFKSKVIELTQTIDELGTSLVKEKEDLEQVKAKSILTQKEIITLNEQLNVSKNAQQEAERLLSADKQIQGQQKSKHLLEIDSLKQSIDKHCSELETQISSNERNKVKVDKLYQTIADLEKDKELSIQKDKEKEDLHQASLVELNKTLTQEKSTIKEYIEQLDSQKTVVEKQAETHKDLLGKFKSADVESSKKIVDLGNKITSLEKNIMALTSENRDLTKNAEESNRIIDGYQQEITHLKENYESANNNAQQVKQRAEANKEKQESEFTKARDTIKYLRDENLDLNTKLDKQVTELEDKLREYRLRFEYAQKQLNS